MFCPPKREKEESQEQGVSEIPFFYMGVRLGVWESFTCYKFPRLRQLGPSGGGGGGGGGGNGGGEEIDDPDVPTGPGDPDDPDDNEIDDPPIPLDPGIPQTGIFNWQNIIVIIATLGAALVLIGLIYRKESSKKK